MIFLTDDMDFPPVSYADPEGVLAIGGKLTESRLIQAYEKGIFPWFEGGSPVLWWSPDPRMVLFPGEIRITKSMRQLLRQRRFRVTYNTAFENVIRSCAEMKRSGQSGTWITEEMIEAYCGLYRKGRARSVEVWDGEELVGGLYGVDLGHVFCGESMFSKVSNASKYGFITLVKDLEENGYKLIDCQIYTNHLASLGADEIPRDEFLRILKKEV
ncbi:leucyl/phenylalanyl-tRNA--protein transferase [Robertkochia solimangrovi]|uniref:leucyl/phenylalanyl-tRNA--protein transferase n=1 Tax=Robertkochia solimangrovi TaxID=2213046 RepID=UPI00117F0D1B|nr:leucyl/phenylalanyl-tRNA--protein transferase [Robertkochia solimangrovi]TRZ44482.1 leucyl/phenylalanyl-tRNA--protein transferase [Robertkochia solimangrovi]